MRVFISHSSKDKPAVEALARALRERGVDAWLDKWMIGPGDDIVAMINEGLEQADAGLIVFSAHTRESRWVEAEVSYLTYARIQEGKALIPVVLGGDAYVPALLRPLARRGIEEVDAIADAVLHRRAGPPPVVSRAVGRCERVLVSLRREGASGVRVQVDLGGKEYGGRVHSALPRQVAVARDAFLRGFRAGLRRGPAEATRTSLESQVADLGRALRALCLPAGAGEALADLADGCGVGTIVEVCFESDAPELLGLPFEALRLPDERLLATLPAVVTLRRQAGLCPKPQSPLAGPIKVLVAVGAPDEGNTRSAVLDYERELQNILDAVEVAQRRENVQVRILEVGHPELVAKAIERDAYHVLHLSCHGGPGQLELEDEDGRAVPTTAEQLVGPIRKLGRPLPLVFLNACHGGVENEQTASFSQALLGAGVPCVLAMQTSVSDHYATQLARSFYEHLARREPPLASRALAQARKEIEQARLEAIRRGAPLAETQPEYATAALYVAGDEAPLADFSLPKEPLRERPVYEVAGPVPQLRIDDLIGRRRELRETLRALRDRSNQLAGVVLTGIGGVGKSALAGRVMQRLAEDGWRVAACSGRFDLQAIAGSVGAALIEADREESQRRARLLMSAALDDAARFHLLGQALAEDPVALVLDDFEQNLVVGGGAFLDPDVGLFLGLLARSARRGRLLVTCRHPVPGTAAYLREIPIGPLSPAETRKLLQRLPGLCGCAPDEIAQALRVIGGHPRILEFLDALLRGAEDKRRLLPHITTKLQETLEAAGVDLATSPSSFDDRLHQVVLLGMRNVLLEGLVAVARGRGDDDVLLQAAVSSLPTSPGGLAHMLADGPADGTRVQSALARLAALSLVFRFPDGAAWVHRWTAEGLARIESPAAHAERCNRAGRYRWWRVANESHDLGDAIEAVRNLLAGRDFDAAAQVARACFDALRRSQQSIGIAALASEVLETLPPDHSSYAPVADEEAQAHLALGLTERARERYESLREMHERRAQAEPDRADYQRDLSVSYERIGDLYRALGQGDQARERYEQALPIYRAIGDKLGQANCIQSLGDIAVEEKDWNAARKLYQDAIAIRRAISPADEAAGYNALGAMYERQKEYSQAIQAYSRALELFPDHVYIWRNRAELYLKMKDATNAARDIETAAGLQPENAYLFLRRGQLAILQGRYAEALTHLAAALERYPRMNYAYFGMGLAHLRAGQADQALKAYQQGLAVTDSPADLDDALEELEALRQDTERGAPAGVEDAWRLVQEWKEQRANR